MSAKLKTQHHANWTLAKEFMDKLKSQGLEHRSFPVPMSSEFIVAWAELPTDEKLTIPMQDWQLLESPDDVKDNQRAKFSANVTLGNQFFVDIMNEDTGEPVIGFILEINKGCPALHLDVDGSDAVLHIHKTVDGLVLSPEFPSVTFCNADVSEYTYNKEHSLLVKESDQATLPHLS